MASIFDDPLNLPRFSPEALAAVRVLIASMRQMQAGRSVLPPSQMLLDAMKITASPLDPHDLVGHMAHMVAQLTVLVCNEERLHIERWIQQQDLAREPEAQPSA